jgi:hypothetical protein
MCYPLNPIVCHGDLVFASDYKRLGLERTGDFGKVLEENIGGVQIDSGRILVSDTTLEVLGSVYEVFTNQLNLKLALVGSVCVLSQSFDSNRRVEIQSRGCREVLRVVGKEETGLSDIEVYVRAELVNVGTLH